jgi:hypothetical protein
MEITYKVINNFGTEHKYPISKDAHVVAALTGKKTLTDFALETIRRAYPDAIITEA